MSFFNLLAPQLAKKFPTFYGTHKFITMFMWSHHLSLSCATSVLSISLPPPTLSSRLILILSSNQSMPISLILRFPHKNPVCTSSPALYILHAPPITFVFIWSPEQCLVRTTDHEAPHYAVPCSLIPFRPKYLHQDPTLAYPQSMFLPQCDRQDFRTTKKKAKSEFFIF